MLAVAATAAPVAADPTVRAWRITDTIDVDGLLDEPSWSAAAAATGFRQREPQEGQPATEPTEASLCYDEQAIYIAFRCSDNQPDAIRCAERRRNGDIWSDDRVGFGLDTQGDGREFYWFYLTPRRIWYNVIKRAGLKAGIVNSLAFMKGIVTRSVRGSG